MQAELLPHFEYLGPAKVKCKACGAEMDTRGGRAKTHLKESHGIDAVKDTPAIKRERVERVTAVVEEQPSEFARGSREWAVQMVLQVADAPESTSEQKLKALDLLKEYQDFGTKRLDDEKEAEASRLQWDRVFSKATEFKKIEETLLKDPAVRIRLGKALEEVK